MICILLFRIFSINKKILRKEYFSDFIFLLISKGTKKSFCYHFRKKIKFTTTYINKKTKVFLFIIIYQQSILFLSITKRCFFHFRGLYLYSSFLNILLNIKYLLWLANFDSRRDFEIFFIVNLTLNIWTLWSC